MNVKVKEVVVVDLAYGWLAEIYVQAFGKVYTIRRAFDDLQGLDEDSRRKVSEDFFWNKIIGCATLSTPGEAETVLGYAAQTLA